MKVPHPFPPKYKFLDETLVGFKISGPSVEPAGVECLSILVASR